MLSVIGTFFGVLFLVLFAVALTSNGALQGPEAFALRWSVLSLAVVFSASLAWLRWRVHAHRTRSSHGALPTRRALDDERVSTADQSARLTDRMNRLAVGRSEKVGAPAPAPSIALPQPSGPATPDGSGGVLAASKQAVVFRQYFPPPHDGSTLSFFGGAPIAPKDFRWPRSRNSANGSKPFTFLMQIDCAAMPEPARLGLLPDRGVLYFFMDLAWSQPDAFRVLYADGPDDEWVVAPPPDDLGAAYGDQAVYVWKWTQSAQECPKLLPRWPFQPVMIEIPRGAYDPAEQEDGEDAPLLWPGEKTTADALRYAQGEEVVSGHFSVGDFIDSDGAMHRPFATYPHDWRAVQIVCALVLDRVGKPHRLPGTASLRHLSETERDALVARIRGEAETWFNRAVAQPAHAAVPQSESDQFWSWLADKPWLMRYVIGEAMTMSIEASLVHSREAAARIPSDVARRVHGRHALAVRSDKGLFATTPDRMLAPPVDVQGHQWERAKTHLLLLELSSNEGLGHHFGEGVYQFWITPADLKARRFDKVELTADAY
jgi:hypothetical protein